VLSYVFSEEEMEGIQFLTDNRFNVYSDYNKILEKEKMLVDFLYEYQMAISFDENFLSVVMKNCDPRYAHSKSFFSTQLANIWIDYTIYFLKKKSEESKYILGVLLYIYSDLDGEYQCESLYANKIFRRMYRYELTEDHGIFKNKLGHMCTVDDLITGLVFYQENGICDGLYRSSFYNVLFSYMLHSIVSELHHQV